MACLHAAQAAPTPVLTQEMYTGRTNAPAPDWTKKAPRQSTKKPPKIKGKKEKEQAQSKPSPTETQTQTQTETPANKQPQ